MSKFRVYLAWFTLLFSLTLIYGCENKLVDDTPPVVVFNGDAVLHIDQYSIFLDPGVTATDNFDENISVVVLGTVDTSIVGSYRLVYTVTDQAGNAASITRNVYVLDPEAFVTTWKTDNPGAGEGKQIKINTVTSDQNYTVNWGDESIDSGVKGSITHNYVTPGTYTVSITGDFKNIKVGYGEYQKILTIEQWGNIQWTTMEQAFAGCGNLILNASDVPDLHLVKNMNLMFNNTQAFKGDLSQWDVSSVLTMAAMFNRASSFDGNIKDWDVSSVTNMESMFSSADSFNGDLSQWDVSNVTNVSGMFAHTDSFNSKLAKWDVSAIKDMAAMFAYTDSFNKDISEWNVSSVEDMGAMFAGAVAFNKDISRWDVSAVKDMVLMFNCSITDCLFDGDISKWNVSSVENMEGMFGGAKIFNGNISQWDVASVKNMRGMFRGAIAFNGDISQWDVSSVSDMQEMFSGAKAFSGDISQWDVSAVTNMQELFSYTKVFIGDISKWDVSSVTNMVMMFEGATLSTENYDALLQGWSNQTVRFGVNFHGGQSHYSSSSLVAREKLLKTFSWNIGDGGLEVGK